MAKRYYNRIEGESSNRERNNRKNYSELAKSICSSLKSYFYICFSAVADYCKRYLFNRRGVNSSIAVVLLCVVVLFIRRCDFDFGTPTINKGALKPYYGYFRNNSHLNRFFNDLNDKHLVAAKANGIQIDKVKGSLDEIVDEWNLEIIEDCSYYEVDKLTHSAPYLVSSAAELLEDICKNFRDSVESKGYPEVKPIVTSVFRTPESVKKLQRSGNVNSSSNSAHLYATTVDITYRRFDGTDMNGADVYKYIMAEVLRDLRNEGRCYVKFEIKQACFHITVR